jgi:hypothetical protein
MSTTPEQIHDALTTYLSVARGGVKLPRRVIAALPGYLLKTLMVKDSEEVEEMGVTGFMRAIASCDAYDGMMPEAVGETAIEWFASEPGEKILKKIAETPPTVEGEVTEPTSTRSTAPARTRKTTASAEEEADAKTMGLASGIAVRCLALSAETGQVHAPHEVGGLLRSSMDHGQARRQVEGMSGLQRRYQQSDGERTFQSAHAVGCEALPHF